MRREGEPVRLRGAGNCSSRTAKKVKPVMVTTGPTAPGVLYVYTARMPVSEQAEHDDAEPDHGGPGQRIPGGQLAPSPIAA